MLDLEEINHFLMGSRIEIATINWIWFDDRLYLIWPSSETYLHCLWPWFSFLKTFYRCWLHHRNFCVRFTKYIYKTARNIIDQSIEFMLYSLFNVRFDRAFGRKSVTGSFKSCVSSMSWLGFYLVIFCGVGDSSSISFSSAPSKVIKSQNSSGKIRVLWR